MAGSKIRGLTEATSPVGTDLVHVVVNPAGTPADRKVKLSNLLTAIGAQPLDSDLAAIAALSTTSFGRGLLIAANAAALRTAAGLGTAALVDTGTGGANVPTITQADARYQPLDSDLTAIAALSTTTFGRGLLALADAAALRASFATGTPDGTKFLRDDGVWAAPGGGTGALVKANTDADNTFSNSSALNTLATLAVPTTVAAGDRLHVVAFGTFKNDTGGNRWFTHFSLGLGATTLADQSAGTTLNTSANDRSWLIDAWLVVVAPASAQRGLGNIRFAPTAIGWAGNTSLLTDADQYFTATEDLTAGKNVTVKAQMDSAAANFSVTLRAAHLELVPKG